MKEELHTDAMWLQRAAFLGKNAKLTNFKEREKSWKSYMRRDLKYKEKSAYS